MENNLLAKILSISQTLIFVVIQALALLSFVYAEGNVEEVAFLGVGAESCSTFMSTYEHNPASLDEHHETSDEGPHHKTDYTSIDYINWVQGYLSGYNKHLNNGNNIANKASNGGVLYFLYRRCSEIPDAPFYSVLPALLERLESR
jgi:hypothetical protein